MRFVRDAFITIVVLIVVVWFIAYYRVRAGGLAADAEPGQFERAVATRLERLSIPAGARELNNPMGTTDPTIWRTAADHYGDHCAGCHGKDGHGKTDMGENLYPKTPDLAGPAVQRLSDGELFYIIEFGVRFTGMPAWGDGSSEGEKIGWNLVHFIRRLPSLTPDEIAEIEQLNPKSP